MKVSRLKSKLKLFYTVFIVPPKKLRLPKKSDVLIYDACGAEVMVPYLIKYSATIMAVRGESINVPCLLRAALRLSFWKGKPLNAYAEEFIKAVSPKVVITSIDNNISFYTVSKNFPSIKTIFLQNGTRSESGDVFDRLNILEKTNYYVDYMLVHGEAIGMHYMKYVTGQFVPIGSLKNNAVSISRSELVGDVLFISQWHNKPEGDSPFYIEQDGTPVYWEQFFAVEIITLKFLSRWCAENSKCLKICGREKDKDGTEKQFFADCLKESVWEYLPRIDNCSSYKYIDSAEIVVFIDSTLGYESIGRGKRTASFSCRMTNGKKNFFKFGWPADLPSNGPFWTNDQDEAQFQRVMDYLNTTSDEGWEQARQRYSLDLMEFDLGNKCFIALLDQLLLVQDTSYNSLNLRADGHSKTFIYERI